MQLDAVLQLPQRASRITADAMNRAVESTRCVQPHSSVEGEARSICCKLLAITGAENKLPDATRQAWKRSMQLHTCGLERLYSLLRIDTVPLLGLLHHT